MILCRRPRLATTLAVLCFSLPSVVAQQAAPPQQKKQNPFEAVPQSTEPPKPQEPKPVLEAPKAAEEPKPEALENVIESIEFRGARRVPQDTLRALTFTKKGDRLDGDAL